MRQLKSVIKRRFPILAYILKYIKSIPLRLRSMESVFTEIYHKTKWGGSESRSGPGSSLIQTTALRAKLPLLLKEISTRSFLDIPCGDCYWMSKVELDVDLYIGADIAQDLIEDNMQRFGNSKRHFVKLDIAKHRLPQVDVVFCRDLLVHYSFKDIFQAVDNIKKSNSKYLLTTTFTRLETNEDIITGRWRPLNLQKAPFYFPDPIRIINEECTERDGRYSDKSLGLWNIADL